MSQERGGKAIGGVVERVVRLAEGSKSSFYRLVLVVGEAQSGKSEVLRQINASRGWPLLNVNLLLSEQLLELPQRLRALRTPTIVRDLVGERTGSVLLLDNLELLFSPSLQQDPLRLLQSVSRNRAIIASWRGSTQSRSLTYASPDHPEFRRYDEPQALIVDLSHPVHVGGELPSQEQIA